MPWSLQRFQQAGCLHFVTFSCHHRDPLLAEAHARNVFEQTLERVRQWYGFFVTGYVVMPEHVHLLVSEPERPCHGHPDVEAECLAPATPTR